MGYLEYKFPFDTCEPRRLGAAVLQPVSAAINAASTVLLLACASFASNGYVSATLLTYAAFEAFHTYTHARHVPGPWQKRAVHALGLAMALATLVMLIHFLGPPGASYWAALAVLVALDGAALATGADLLGVATGLGVFAWVVVGRWASLPQDVRACLQYVLAGTLMLLLLFVNEALHCPALLRWRALPYHAAIELLGLALFAGLARAWLLLADVQSSR